MCLITITIILTTIPVGRGAVGESTRKEEPPSATKTSFMMGTLVSIKAYGPNAQNAVDAAFARIRDIESEVSASLPDSEISELNLSAGKAPVRISRDTEILLREALRFARASGGKFDPTIGPLVKLWQIGTDKAHIPPAAEIEAAMHLVRYQDLIVNEKDGTAFLRRPGMAVDLGAIAKGYAGDEVIRILKDAGIRSGYVDLGGNVVVLGSKPDGTPWRVGVQDPRGERGDYVLAIPVVDKSVVTSGDYERYFEKDGVRYHHILDPFTGWPSRSGLISATIISDRSIDGDALSTTVFLLGPDKGMKLIEELPGIDGVLITTDKKILVSRGIQDKVEWPHGSSKYRYEKAAQ
ncbi:MAG TPA: FAD:protein FMN transferase [Firmicutes bacterium]|nr:FAD:protein FMN transferase [Bacillota bacterium]